MNASANNPPLHVGGYERFLDYDKSLACIHCGLCLSACPTYLETGNENDSPRGRIYLMRAVQDGRMALNQSVVRHIDLCLGCRACEVACPSGVQYGELLEATREHIEKKHRRSFFQQFLRRVAIEQIFPFPRRTKLALLPAKLIQSLRLESLLPKFVRDAVALVPHNTREVKLTELSPATSEPKRGRVGFISGCVMSVMFGKTNAASLRLLNQRGYDVVTPAAQVCCGALYAHSGNLNRARECARTNIDIFEKLNLDAIIINAAGCGSTLKEYGHLLHDDPKWAERGMEFSAKVKDLAEWIANAPQLSTLHSPLSTVPVTYHDACHLAHAQRITKPPRELVRAVAGKNLIELAESDVCCGSAGSYNLTEPEMAERLQKRKIDNILKTGAQIVVTTNPGCILQIQAGLRKAGASQIQVMHIADYLAAAE
ncbi:MAG: 4Fe-4S dicluster domain-containing protein [Verrucomicrobia bacterium]|nr:4Fe-4S dicluster domain-containing protein [Verrucomicrobiota bacterium]